METMEIITELEEETLKARSLAETIRLIYVASCGNEGGQIPLNNITHSLFHIWNMVDSHKQKIEELTDELYKLHLNQKAV